MIDPELTIVRLTAHDANALLPIYEEALPPEERKPADAIRQCLVRSDYHVLGARAQTGRLLGFATVFVSRVESVALLEYLATDKASRGKGVGALLFNAGLAAIQERPLLIEVDAVCGVADPRAPARRRQAFYRRLGCETITSLAYRMPQVGGGEPPPMDLLIHRNGRDAPITNKELHAWLSDIFLRVYDGQSGQPEIDAMIGGTDGMASIA